MAMGPNGNGHFNQTGTVVAPISGAASVAIVATAVDD